MTITDPWVESPSLERLRTQWRGRAAGTPEDVTNAFAYLDQLLTKMASGVIHPAHVDELVSVAWQQLALIFEHTEGLAAIAALPGRRHQKRGTHPNAETVELPEVG